MVWSSATKMRMRPFVALPGLFLAFSLPILFKSIDTGHDDDPCSRTRFAAYCKGCPDLFGALFHPDQPETPALDPIDNKPIAVVLKFQTNCVGIEREPRSEFARVRVLQRVRQSFLSNAEQIFLHTRRKLARLTL